MPIYEFEELIAQERDSRDITDWSDNAREGYLLEEDAGELPYKINCWGYGAGSYFAPKASFAAGECPDAELKSCILKMHKKGMECILEMDFGDCLPAWFILEVLKFWVREYHVDGFHLQGSRIPMDILMQEPYLGRTKLFYRGISEDMIDGQESAFPRIFVDTDEFMYPCRRLAAGIDGNVWDLANQMKKQNERLGHINYIADNNDFTLADLFSYEKKHNEQNGEGNLDGPDFSLNINCGVEGESSSRNIQRIRLRRMKNAAAMLFLSQGVPMLMAGDEDCNSQQGNNNAYCQDNSIGWKDWKSSRSSKEFFGRSMLFCVWNSLCGSQTPSRPGTRICRTMRKMLGLRRSILTVRRLGFYIVENMRVRQRMFLSGLIFAISRKNWRCQNRGAGANGTWLWIL